MLKLYDHPLSPYAQKVRIALREKGLDFEQEIPAGMGSGSASGDFADGNPRTEVPLLIDGETRIFDSTIMLEYLEDKWPTPALLPKSPADRARVRMIEDVADTHYEAINWGMGELSWFRRAEGELADKLRARAAEQTRGLSQWMERQLGEAEWFNGESFGWGDLAVVPPVGNSYAFGLGQALGARISAWFERARSRKSVAQTLDEARDFVRNPQRAAPAPGVFKRQYRDHRLEWMIKSGGLEVVLKGLEADNLRFTADFA
jgi:glutathione S-transferase